MQISTLMAAGVACGLLAATAATVYLTNRPAPLAPPERAHSAEPRHLVLPPPIIDRDKQARAVIAELERDGYRCIDGQLFRKEGIEWKQLGLCPRLKNGQQGARRAQQRSP